MTDELEPLPPCEITVRPRRETEKDSRGRFGDAIRVDASFPDFVTFRDQAIRGASAMRTDRRSSRKISEDKWSGTRDWDGAVALASSGWEEGAERARRAVAEFSSICGLIRQRDPIRDVIGATVDVGAFLAGEPECWIRYSPGATTPGAGDQTIRIMVNVSASCNVSTEALIDRGIAALGLALAFDAAGLPAEIIGCETINDGADIASITFPIKPAAASFDVSLVAYALAHPSTLRRLVFSLEEQWPETVRRKFGIPGGYGYPCDDPLLENQPATIYLGAMHGSEHATFNSPERRLIWIKEQLAKFGVSFHGETAPGPSPAEDGEGRD